MAATTDDNKDGRNDAAILYPERDGTVAGVSVLMHEYTWAEGLEHHALVDTLTDAMTGIALAGDFHDLDSLRAAFGKNKEVLFQLIAIASGQPVEWIAGLNDIEGERLFLLWWGVNADFFLRRVLRSVQLAKVRQLAGLTSSPDLSVQGTTRSYSEATPADS